jgi:hypothetical protein
MSTGKPGDGGQKRHDSGCLLFFLHDAWRHPEIMKIMNFSNSRGELKKGDFYVYSNGFD